MKLQDDGITQETLRNKMNEHVSWKENKIQKYVSNVKDERDKRLKHLPLKMQVSGYRMSIVARSSNVVGAFCWKIPSARFERRRGLGDLRTASDDCDSGLRE